MRLPNGLAEEEIPEGLWPVGVPMAGHQIVGGAPEGMALAYDPEDHMTDIEWKRCRSLKPGPQGCGGFRVKDSDYCQGHKTMIENENKA